MFPWIYEHILTVILLSPLLGILILLIVPRKHEEASSEVALVSSILTLFFSLIMIGLSRGSVRFAFSDKIDWLPWLGTSYHVAVDGLSSILVLIVAVLTLFTILINWRSIKTFRKEAFAALLFLELGLIGLFSAVDVLLMYVFLEVSVVFLGVSVLLFRGTREKFLSTYLVFMSLSSLLFLVVVIFLIMAAGSADLLAVEKVQLAEGVGIWIFILLLIGTAIRMGLFPFHTWLSNVDDESTDFVLLPIGLLFIGAGYFFYRLLPPFAMFVSFSSVPLTWIVASSILITALASTVQKNFASFVLYVLRVHFGFVLLGIISLNQQGFTGSGMQMISSAVSLSALSVILAIFRKRGLLASDDGLKGVFAKTPILGISFLIILFSLAGLPGLAHFPGLFMIWMGLFKGSWVLTLVALLGIVLITVRLLKFVGLSLYRGDTEESGFLKLTRAQVFFVVIFVLIIMGIGIFPDLLLENIRQSTEATWKVLIQQL